MSDSLRITKHYPISILIHAILENRASIILDACGSEEILNKVIQLSPDQCVCLFRGKAFEDLWAVAPYLVQLDESVFNWLINTVWDEPWGVLIITDCGKRALHKHLRKFLFIQDSLKKTLYFRFYDPRVLDSFIPTCNDSELIKFFGPILKIGIKLENPGVFKIMNLSYNSSDQVNSETGLFRLRNQQLNELHHQKNQAFKCSLTEYLTNKLFLTNFDNKYDLSTQLDRYILQAKAFKLERECDIAHFIEILFQHGNPSQLLAEKEVLNLLHDHRICSEDKLNRLHLWIKNH